MCKREKRARLERSLRLSLSKLVMPALWLGPACTAHAPAHAPCSTVYDFQDGTNSRCPLSRPDGIYPIGYATDEEAGPPAPFPRAQIYTPRPEIVAREIKAAIEGCDRAKLWDAILGYEEFSSFVRTPLAQETYAQMIKECMAMHLQDICEESPMEPFPRLGEPKIQKIVAVPAGGEWKRAFTLVTIALFDQGPNPPKPRPRLMLVEFNGDWWILPKTQGR